MKTNLIVFLKIKYNATNLLDNLIKSNDIISRNSLLFTLIQNNLFSTTPVTHNVFPARGDISPKKKSLLNHVSADIVEIS